MTQLPERELIDKNQLFGTEHLKADLKGRAVRGGAFTLGGQGMSFLLQMASTVILARLLTPQDYGLIAMITAVTGFVALFKDLGLSMATVQKDRITHEQISTLFWINVALSVMVMLVAMALAPAIAWFYGEPKLQPLTLVMAVGFVFGGLCAQHSALLRRQMRFGTLALIDILRLAVSVVVGIITALAGAGVWALVYMTLSGSLFNAVAVWIVCCWRPSLPVRHAGVRSMLGFGANLTGFNILNYFARNLDNVLIGRFCDADVLGVYNKAYNLLLLPIEQINGPVTAVALPALSRLQNQPERFKSYYTKGIFLVAFITMPIVLFLFAASELAILIVLGSQWVNAATIFRLLMPAAFIGTFNIATGWVYISLGQPNRQFRMGIVCALVTMMSFAIGIRWGAIGVASAFSIANCVMLYPRIIYCFRRSPLHVKDLLNALWKPAVASLVACASVFSVGSVLSLDYGAVVEFTIKLSVFGVMYILSWCLMPKGRETLYEVLHTMRDLRSIPKGGI